MMMIESILITIFGMAGALFYYLVVNEGKLILPHFDAQGYFYLGVVFNLIVGAVFGALSPFGLMTVIRAFFPSLPYVANNYVTALLAGIVSPLVIEKLVEFVGGHTSNGKASGNGVWPL